MPRDTYNDFITDEELCDLPLSAKYGQSQADLLLSRRMGELRARAGGGIGNPSRKEHLVRDEAARCYRLSISFDSRAWTGLA